MKFMYALGNNLHSFEFEVAFNILLEPHIPAKALCEALQINSKYQSHRPKETLALTLGGRMATYWTLETVATFFEQMVQPNSFKKTKPETQTLLLKFKADFLNAVRAHLNPSVQALVHDVWAETAETGEAALRADLAKMGATPSEINYYVDSGMTQTVVTNVSMPYPSSTTQEIITSERLVERRFEVREYQKGYLYRQGAVLLSQFCAANPEHKHATRRLTGLEHDISEDGKSIIYTGPQTETKPWDNEQPPTTRTRKAKESKILKI